MLNASDVARSAAARATLSKNVTEISTFQSFRTRNKYFIPSMLQSFSVTKFFGYKIFWLQNISVTSILAAKYFGCKVFLVIKYLVIKHYGYKANRLHGK